MSQTAQETSILSIDRIKKVKARRYFARKLPMYLSLELVNLIGEVKSANMYGVTCCFEFI